MNAPFSIRPAPSRTSYRTAGAIWLGLAILGVMPTGAVLGGGPGGRLPAGPPRAARSRSSQTLPVPLIQDIALQPGGVLLGRVSGALCARRANPAAGLRVRLWRANQDVAQTTANTGGRFSFGKLSGGLYGVVVETADGPAWQICRLWSPSTAPPRASNVLTVPLWGPVVRGQSRLFSPSFPKGAAVTAVAAGAIAAPILYYSGKRDDHIPASP